jgi:hypothetical protein
VTQPHAPSLDDAGAADVAQITGLQSLNIGATKLTDAGLEKLAALKSLRVLEVTSGNRYTFAGVRKLQKAIPGLVVP